MYLAYPAGSSCWNAFALNFIVGFVFFHKAMYNRFRFAHLGIFTKTSETYLFAAVAVSVLCRFVIQADSLIPVMLTLGVLTFFRAMGNPLEQDTQMEHFLLIPESTWHKLFWSLMGGTTNCFLDLSKANHIDCHSATVTGY